MIAVLDQVSCGRHCRTDSPSAMNNSLTRLMHHYVFKSAPPSLYSACTQDIIETASLGVVERIRPMTMIGFVEPP